MNEKQIEEISKLYYLLRKAPDLSLGLDIILESALNTLDMDIGALLIINDKEKVIKMRSFKSKIKKLELPESYALNGEFIELKALRMNSPTSEILKNPELSILKMNSIHCVPIHIGKEVSGVLSIGSQKDLTLNSIEIGILTLYSALISSLFETYRSEVVPVKEVVEEVIKKPLKLEFGNSYLVKDDIDKAYKIFADAVLSELPGLCVTREFPPKIRNKYGLKRTPILWLNEEQVEEEKTVFSIQELSIVLTQSLEMVEHCIVLLDGIEYLITNSGFERVLRFLQLMRSRFERKASILIIPILEKALDVKEIKLIEREIKLLAID